MNEIFRLVTIYHILQDEIEVNLQCTHFPRPPKELAIIVMKSTQVQVGKFPIVTSYCFVLGGGLKLMM
jgi:hypothetical protein